MIRPRLRVVAVLCCAVVTLSLPAWALRATDPGRFSHLVVADPSSQAGIAAETPDSIPGFDLEIAGWSAFRSAHGDSWDVYIDRRSGSPLLVQGVGIPWFSPEGPAPSLAELETRARAFLNENAVLFRVDPGQLVLDPSASGNLDRDHQVLTFQRAVDGITVEGHRFIFSVSHGNLVSFGATRWGALSRAPRAVYSVDTARLVLHAYMGLQSSDAVEEVESGTPILVTTAEGISSAGPYRAKVGEGTAFRLAYRFGLRVADEPGTWLGLVDAITGEVIAFYDTNKYSQVRGGVYPVSDDGICPDGCVQPGYPMPYADVTVAGTPQTAGDMGLFSCSPAGGAAVTTLAGPYVRVQDVCGPISETAICDADVDLRQEPGTDCAVPAGSSAGNTHASRSSFYHLNRVMEKGRAWLPSNTWLQSQLVDNVNINSTCNAYWDGSVNFYKSGGGCRNTGEIAGVFVHEWGHGLDANDGGGYDNPSEAYADVVAFFQTHVSCIGRGFFIGGNCDGYGNACLNCTGIRDQDWDQRASHTPSTPSGFIQNNCGGGGGPCGKEEHCEGYLAGETIWDLARRDLPAAGLDTPTAWQIADRLFYKSRLGSGGNAYNCAIPNSDGCNAGGWFNTMRTVDDDDGNLANGTPHAAAIFAAFDRHKIACGLATDTSNQNSSICPSLTLPALSASPGSSAVNLSWSAVGGASNYIVLRNDLGCDAGHTVIATVPATQTTYQDTELPNAFNVHYAVQAEGASTSCLSPLSNCVTVAPLPRKGEVKLDSGVYGCSDAIAIRVLDLDLNANSNVAETLQVTVSSTTEPSPETVTLTETGPSTSQFAGTIETAAGAAVAGDGVLQVASGDLLTVTYQDADDGTGKAIATFKDATADCGSPTITDIRVTDVTDFSAVVRWTTSEATTGQVEWGPTPALGNVASDPTLVTSHAATLQSFNECGRVYFRVSSTDAQGNVRNADAGGSPFAFNAQRIPGLFLDGFETNTGWTNEGEWQIGAPQGRGHGPDPSVAFAGAKVLGHDLTGLGANPGDYEPSRTERAISPVINASSLTGGQLKFRRWLNTSGNASAAVEVRKNGAWNQVWASPQFVGVSETDWSFQTIDISQYADGNSQMQIAFRQGGGPSFIGARAGWNVDRIVVKSASDPDFVSCGGCGGAPTFAGAASATDLASCGDTGVRIDWQPAPSWGTGTGGTYSVYRDTVPGFTPSAGNRIVTGLAGGSYTDPAAPNAVTLYYLVRAENNETCSSGPNNGGVIDTNTAYVSARDETSQPAPGTIGSSLRVSTVNDAHVRLTWSVSPTAFRYRVYRSDSSQGTRTLIGEPTTTLFEDQDELPSGIDRYYSVVTVDACGNEGS